MDSEELGIYEEGGVHEWSMKKTLNALISGLNIKALTFEATKK